MKTILAVDSVEWMYSRNGSVKAEYLYTDLGSADFASLVRPFLAPYTLLTVSLPTLPSTVRVGVNYRF